jgi:hypothetical protein
LVEGTALNCHSTLDLPTAYLCITAAKEEMEELVDNTGKYQLSLGYATVAGGTAAGYQLVKAMPNMTAVRNTGVLLAALVGMDSVVNATSQRQALLAGVKALSCVENAGRAAELTSNLAGNPPDDSAIRASFSSSSISANTFASNILGIDSAAPTAAANNAIARLSERILTRMQFQLAAKSEFQKAAKDAANRPTLAGRLRVAMVSIRSSVRAQLLAKVVDLQQIFKDQQQRVGQIVGEAVGKSQKAKQATDEVNVFAVAAKEPMAADDTKEAAKPVVDTYQECVATLPSS